MKLNYAIALIWSLHLVGFVAMRIPFSREFFEALTPLNLLICAALYIFFQQKTKGFWLFCGITFFGGYFLELLGVHSEIIFGKYAYLHHLGIKIFEVPVIIGMNWLILVGVIGSVLSGIRLNILAQILLAALAMSLTDVLIEPVAVEHSWWHWFGQDVPLQNYVAWFLGAVFFMSIFYTQKFEKHNPLAKHLWAAQVVFFALHWLF